MFKASKILIAGANGVLGYAVAREFAGRSSCLLTGVEKDSASAEELGLEYRTMDITDTEDLHKNLDEFRPEVLINCAAFTSVDGCESQVALSRSVNAEAPVNMAWAAAERAILLVHYSSDYLFDGLSGPYGEEAEVNPINNYGRQKLEAEQGISASHCEHIILRTNVLYGRGPRQDASFVRFVVDSLKSGKRIRIVDDQFNNPTYSDDLALATRVLIEQEARLVFNYAGRDYLSRLDFARMIAEIYDLDDGLIDAVSTEELGLPAPRPLKGGLIVSKIRQFSGVPDRSLKEILMQMKESAI